MVIKDAAKFFSVELLPSAFDGEDDDAIQWPDIISCTRPGQRVFAKGHFYFFERAKFPTARISPPRPRTKILPKSTVGNLSLHPCRVGSSQIAPNVRPNHGELIGGLVSCMRGFLGIRFGQISLAIGSSRHHLHHIQRSIYLTLSTVAIMIRYYPYLHPTVACRQHFCFFNNSTS